MLSLSSEQIIYQPKAAADLLSAYLASTTEVLRGVGDRQCFYLNNSYGLTGPFYGGLELADKLLAEEVIQFVDKNGEYLPTIHRHHFHCRTWLNQKLTSSLVERHIPILRATVRSPAYDLSGVKLKQVPPGYYAARKWRVTGQFNPMPVDPAYPHLVTLFSGMTFVHPTDRGNLTGWTVAAVARTAIREFPILILNGTSKGVGKTTVAQAISTLIYGQERAPISFTNNEEEFEKRIGDFADIPGPNIMVCDNIRAKRRQTGEVRSQALSTAATTGVASGRVLYRGMRPVHYIIPIFTMNEASVEHDLHDKALHISLTRPAGLHEKDAPYFDPYPLKYVQVHRHELLAEIANLLESLTLDASFTPVGRMKGFEQIATLACQTLGLPYDFSPHVESLDATLIELVRAVEASEKQPVLIDDVVERVITNPDSFPQLNDGFLQKRYTGVGQRRQYIFNRLQHYVSVCPTCGLEVFKVDTKLFARYTPKA
jgi:hypothetical protein